MKNIFIVICVLFANCEGAQIKSNVGARHSQYVTSEETWTNPYVTDGLVAMWDGEWNIGGGMHDDNAPTWIDISGNGYDLSIADSGVEIGDNYIIVPAGTILDSGKLESVSHVEAVIECIKTTPFFIGVIIHTGNYSSCMSLRYKWLGFGRSTCSQIGTDSRLQLASYSLCQGYVFRNGTLQATSSYTYNFNDTLGFGIGATEAVSIRVMNIRFYSRVLTEDEMLWNYSVDRERFNIP